MIATSVRMLQRRDPAAVDARRNQAVLPTVDEFAALMEFTANNPTDPAALTVGDIQPDWGPRVPRAGHR